MAIAPITEWLKNPEYDSGVKLYQEFGKNNFLKQAFASHKLLLQQLVKSLADINATTTIQEPTPVLKKEVEPPAKAEKKSILIDKKNVPKEVLELEIKWKDHYSRADVLHRDLPHTINKETRRLMAVELLQHMSLVRSIWYQLQYFNEHGKLPVTASEDDLSNDDLIGLINKIKNLPTYITKAQKRISEIKDPEKLQKHLSEIDKNKASLDAAWKRIEFLNEQIKEKGL